MLYDQLLQEGLIDSLPWRNLTVVRRPVAVQSSQFNQAFLRSVDATAVSATPGSPYDLARKEANLYLNQQWQLSHLPPDIRPAVTSPKFTYPACTGCFSHIDAWYFVYSMHLFTGCRCEYSPVVTKPDVPCTFPPVAQQHTSLYVQDVPSPMPLSSVVAPRRGPQVPVEEPKYTFYLCQDQNCAGWTDSDANNWTFSHSRYVQLGCKCLSLIHI